MQDLIITEFSNLFLESVSTAGITAELLPESSSALERVHSELHERVDSGELPFLSVHKDVEIFDRISAFARTCTERFDDCVVLGIGGSSLGGRTLVRALGGKGLRVHFPDNLDPVTFGRLLDDLDLGRTVFNCISKSGGTLETMAQFMVVRDRLLRDFGAAGYAERMVVTTDPQTGVLRRLVEEEGLTAFEIPPGIGGRFSVFTPVGLLPAALAGVDIHALMAGVGREIDQMLTADTEKNTALGIAALLHALDTRAGRSVLFTAAYSDALAPLGEWFQQLWAESLGKANGGPTPVAAVGATCQHSLLQLWMEGPPNSVVAFLQLDSFERDIVVPMLDSVKYPEVSWIGGHGMARILNTEKLATEEALTRANRPNFTWRLKTLTPESLGALMIQMEAMTAYAGGLYGIDPFDQPGVEAGKIIARRMLSD